VHAVHTIRAGQQELALAVWALTALLFAAFSCLLLGRAIMWPRTMLHMVNHPLQSLFVGAVPMSVSTLTNGVVALWQPWFGLGAARAAQVLFW
jgi:tellurite resistance protein TehA-like permease